MLRISDDAYSEDSVNATPQDIIVLARFERTYEDIHQFCANSKLVLAYSGRHLSAELPAVFVPAELVEVATLSEVSWLR